MKVSIQKDKDAFFKRISNEIELDKCYCVIDPNGDTLSKCTNCNNGVISRCSDGQYYLSNNGVEKYGKINKDCFISDESGTLKVSFDNDILKPPYCNAYVIFSGLEDLMRLGMKYFSMSEIENIAHRTGIPVCDLKKIEWL